MFAFTCWVNICVGRCFPDDFRHTVNGSQEKTENLTRRTHKVNHIGVKSYGLARKVSGEGRTARNKQLVEEEEIQRWWQELLQNKSLRISNLKEVLENTEFLNIFFSNNAYLCSMNLKQEVETIV